MKRDLKAMAEETFDLLIVGGGVTGASVAWDASLRGLKVGLVEREDFGHATTAASSKLIHGGLRYLQNFELGLVRESLRERRLWSQNAPHMVYPLTFVLPTKGLGLRGRTLLNIGLTLYDWLSFDRNRLDDPDQHIPAHRNLSRAEAIAMEPGLESTGLSGAMVYHDCQMHYPERLNLELLLGAAANGAQMANHAEVTEFLKEDGGEGGATGEASGEGTEQRITGVRVLDTVSGETHEIRGRVVLNASGPWGDVMMGKIAGHESPRRLIRSKGIHLITHDLTKGHAIAAAAPGGGHFFILPWRGHSILGTTDTIYEGDPDAFGVTEKDICDFIDLVNEGYPAAKLKRDDILHFYGGMRPLVDRQTKVDVGSSSDGDGAEDEDETYTASRAAEVYDHEAQGGAPGAISAIGGKWTTSRELAEQVVDLALKKLGKPEAAATTENRATYGGDVGRYADFERRAIEERGVLTESQAVNLARNYGSRMTDVTRLIEENGEFGEAICDTRPTIAAEVIHAVREEMAMTLEDVLFRRTGIGTLGNPGEAALNKVVDLMARELGWDESEKTRQMEAALKKFEPLKGEFSEAGEAASAEHK